MTNPYDEQFYRSITDSARASAREVLPIVQSWLRPQSVADVGCGIGTWLSVWRELGVNDVLGVDGEYVERARLEIPSEQFQAFDLQQPLRLNRNFDLVMSLEVAEHLPPSRAESFVTSLTQLGSVILFSAAIPHQGGTHHVNEQWPEYWVRLFEARGFAPLDALRARCWNNERVEWYYAQNLLLFVQEERLAELPPLPIKEPAVPLALVHPRKYQEVIDWHANIHQAILELGALLPFEDAFLLVDDDQFGGLLRAVRRAWPFPEQDGYYNGAPLDSAAALAELARQQAAGVRWIVFVWPTFWWLNYYQEFAAYLRTNFPCPIENERLIVFDLRNFVPPSNL
ncbi:MAG: class I SAM-dependent methyltransferase [Blastocatellia bacterium]